MEEVYICYAVEEKEDDIKEYGMSRCMDDEYFDLPYEDISYTLSI